MLMIIHRCLHILWYNFDVELENHGYYTIRPYFIFKKIKINSRSGPKGSQFDLDLF